MPIFPYQLLDVTDNVFKLGRKMSERKFYRSSPENQSLKWNSLVAFNFTVWLELNCGVFFFILKQIHLDEFLGCWVVRKSGREHYECGYTCMCVCVFVSMCVYIGEAVRNIYCEEYLRLITVCYVSPAQFWAHVRKQIRMVAVCFIPAFLGQHGYHGDSVTAIGFGTDWKYIPDSYLNPSWLC